MPVARGVLRGLHEPGTWLFDDRAELTAEMRRASDLVMGRERLERIDSGNATGLLARNDEVGTERHHGLEQSIDADARDVARERLDRPPDLAVTRRELRAERRRACRDTLQVDTGVLFLDAERLDRLPMGVDGVVLLGEV